MQTIKRVTLEDKSKFKLRFLDQTADVNLLISCLTFRWNVQSESLFKKEKKNQ